METKSPTTSLKIREMIGTDQFSARREVFDKYDTVFVPMPTPTALTPTYKEEEPAFDSNHVKTTSNFKRNGPVYSSMRETRTEDNNNIEFRTRKYSDNFASDHNRSDEYGYRCSISERTRRLSKLRKDFLESNLHSPGESSLNRSGVRASVPTHRVTAKYKVELPNIHKFPFAEPYSTPPPVRKVVVDMGPVDVDQVDKNVNDGKENEDPDSRKQCKSMPVTINNNKADHQKLFEELVKRYSPQRKPVDWTLPPTKPKVVGSIPKASNLNGDASNDNQDKDAANVDSIININDASNCKDKSNIVKAPLAETPEKNDRVPELPAIQNFIEIELPKKINNDHVNDLNIPALIEKIKMEGDELESHKKDKCKIKRKRSFLDKLLGRNKGDKRHGKSS